MNLEAIIKELNLTGWIVLNLFQYSQTEWGCRLQKKTSNGVSQDVFTEICQGKTPVDALQAALFNARQARNNPVKLGKSVVSKAAPGLTVEQTLSMANSCRALRDAFEHYRSA